MEILVGKGVIHLNYLFGNFKLMLAKLYESEVKKVREKEMRSQNMLTKRGSNGHFDKIGRLITPSSKGKIAEVFATAAGMAQVVMEEALTSTIMAQINLDVRDYLASKNGELFF